MLEVAGQLLATNASVKQPILVQPIADLSDPPSGEVNWRRPYNHQDSESASPGRKTI